MDTPNYIYIKISIKTKIDHLPTLAEVVLTFALQSIENKNYSVKILIISALSLVFKISCRFSALLKSRLTSAKN